MPEDRAAEVKRIRDELRLSMAGLGGALQPPVSAQAVNQWEHGVNRPSDETMTKLRTLLAAHRGVSPISEVTVTPMSAGSSGITVTRADGSAQRFQLPANFRAVRITATGDVVLEK